MIGQGTSYPRLYTEKQEQPEEPPKEEPVHNTLEMEKALYALITAGRPDLLGAMFEKPPTGRVGKIAHSEMRQRKNTFIIAAALASRAAIAGGMQQDAAFTMSDLYIQKAELLNDHQQLTLLSVEMLFAYAKQVESINFHGSRSKLVAEAAAFIRENIDQKMTTGSIAAGLGLSRTHLCRRFKNEAGVTLNEFATEQKMLEAKRLLATTRQSALQISEYLGYSSQGYFQNVFKKQVGCTPKHYREQTS